MVSRVPSPTREVIAAARYPGLAATNRHASSGVETATLVQTASVPAVSRSTDSTDTTGDDAPSTAFKDRIDARLVAHLAAAFERAWPGFPSAAFESRATDGLAQLELKARIAQVAAALHGALPEDVEAAAAIVGRVLDEVDRGDSTMDGWELWPVTDWVALAARGHTEVGLELLGRLTRYATGEFAIRPFLDDDPEVVLAELSRWVDGDDEHRRRLASEGTRPRLPWAPRLRIAAEDPGFAVDLLDRLVTDPSEYVRRSVSNHLNDLTRCDEELALGVAQRWLEGAERHGEEDRARAEWVVRRGLRSLVKAGEPRALRLLGHEPDVAVTAEHFEVLTSRISLGDAAEWTLDLVSAEPDTHRVVVDYVIHFVGAAGRTGRKVFKWSTFDLAAGERRRLRRRHPVRPITTRTYRSGEHRIAVQVNGTVVAQGAFHLEVPDQGG